ncbi:N-acetyl-gamma-glutamyl-phosphate reductase [Enterococcus rivorum]|uniref:N-acetyl-gamma-glutamyl-phosphate reductase n=1 Tax=Enterococcus rivorum TaxID=762845 RepID=A0A1E5KVT4_9ENTE|nr:N-acetyl-gamma-glutamyl-phosphate reductase [Enterococcus rivorum]MBP2099011.1 N-acetyl-gamma-glutamyl-phosphate reductase [Enterococcus rivorum]OEH81973.1 N-acetyl-gamma-glutamyl-phosphate reductase [Enterococcus rivorum]
MKVSIVGVTGYSGLELIRYLRQHPKVEIVSIHSHSMHKKSISDINPHLKNIISLPLEEFNAEKIMEGSDLVFFATPSGISKELVQPFVTAEFPIIDLSGDFRLTSGGTYERWYGKTSAPLDLVKKFEYGLAECRKNPKAIWIANPGCYATATELTFAPLLENKLIQLDSMIIDGKSGLSGAGKGLSQTTHFTETNENMSVYKLNQHQHIPEIIQQFKVWAPEIEAIQFSTSLIPVTRGIFLTSYVKASQSISTEQLIDVFKKYYQGKKFIRIQPENQFPELKQVVGSNYCDIGVTYNQTTNIISLVTVIDNLGKGAAGQAVQNLNIMAGFPEELGLNAVPLYP